MKINKFRVYDKNLQRFIAQADITRVVFEASPHTDFSNVVFQQFTGLLDKNGKEIFEGDILKCSAAQMCANNTPTNYSEDEYGIIEYSAPMFAIKALRAIPMFWTGVEVVGNICDNPELLKL